MARVTNVLIVLGVFVVGGILLQIYLSKQESKWPGLIMPGLMFLSSLTLVLNVAAMNDTGAVIATILSVLITGNIPTLILLAIYFACRRRRKKHSEMDKMNIDDL